MKLRKRSEAGGVSAEPTRVGSGLERTPSAKHADAHATEHRYVTTGEVVDTSRELRDEIQKADVEDTEKEHERRRLEFRTVQRKREPIRTDFGKIVETHWTTDLYAAWNRVRGALKVGEQRSEHGHVMLALDEARIIAEEAYGLMLTAKLEAKRWEAANEVTFGAMWGEARREAERERKTSGFSKAVTDQDVRAKCAVLYPDEYAAQEHDREKVKLTVDRMTNLAKLAADKADDVRAMLKGQRG